MTNGNDHERITISIPNEELTKVDALRMKWNSNSRSQFFRECVEKMVQQELGTEVFEVIPVRIPRGKMRIIRHFLNYKDNDIPLPLALDIDDLIRSAVEDYINKWLGILKNSPEL